MEKYRVISGNRIIEECDSYNEAIKIAIDSQDKGEIAINILGKDEDGNWYYLDENGNIPS